MPFDDSRRLTGSNLFFDSAGAVLDAVVDMDAAAVAGWRERVERARCDLKWPGPLDAATGSDAHRTPWSAARGAVYAIRSHATGTLLAVAAPVDQLYTATEVNEWALCASLRGSDPVRWATLEATLIEAASAAAANAMESTADPTQVPLPATFAAASLPVLDDDAALRRFAVLAAIEAAPRLSQIVALARSRALPCVLDDDLLTLGSGEGARTWPLDALPDPAEVPWNDLRAVPAAVVTGSNGKTTTVRLLAAFVRAQGLRDGYNCTDGLYIAGEQVASGDYSGPVGARTVLRSDRVQTAILETARGGILRRGLAVDRARVAVVTNVSADHFGEYGIHDLASLADVKLVVASVVDRDGLLVLNADDPILLERAESIERPIGWFARDFESPTLRRHRERGGWTSGVRSGRLVVSRIAARERASKVKSHDEFDAGDVAAMPLTVGGSAGYNLSNVAGAALAAIIGLGIAPANVAQVLARFGADAADNPGRLMRYAYRGAQALVDYAHNPEGLRGLMDVARHLLGSSGGRIALLLGQAGNRETADIERLAATAAACRPDLIVVKETESFLRGRAPGEVPAILHAALLSAGMPESSVAVSIGELDAARRVLEWSRPGDVLVLPVHDRSNRAAVIELLAAGAG